MSLVQERSMLELPSQVALLERMQLLANFSSNLIHVTGESGAGKTWLAQRYLEAWAEDKNQSLLMCFHNQSDAQRRHTILNQLRSGISCDPDAELIDSFYQLFAEESCNVTIVIDNAQLLSEILLSELWTLVLEAQSQPKWSINVILFAIPKVLDRLLARLSYGQEQKPIDLDIELLSNDEADRLFEFSVMKFVSREMERQVRIAYSKTKKIPGDIMALAEQKMEKRIIIRSIVGSPLNIAIVVLLLILAIGGGYWWFLTQSDLPQVVEERSNSALDIASSDSEQGQELVVLSQTQDQIQSEQSSIEQNTIGQNTNAMLEGSNQSVGESVINDSQPSIMDNQSPNGDQTATVEARTTQPVSGIPTLSADPISATEQSQQSGNLVRLSVPTGQVGTSPNNDSHSLPPSVGANNENVGIDDGERERVVISAEVVDRLLDSNDASAPEVRGAAVQSGLLSARMADPTPAQAEQLTQAATQPPIVAATTSSPAPAPAPASSVSGDRERLLAMSATSYTLQIAAFNTQQDVDAFMRSNNFAGKANIYRTRRQNVTWFIVTYDNFSTLQQARDAAANLPNRVQQLGPWAKSLRQVHREIGQPQ